MSRDVMFKLTTQREPASGLILRLEGHLVAAWLDEFAAAVDAAMGEGAPVTMDLEGLSFADAGGAALLRQAAARGVRLKGGSEFIGALIGMERSR